MFVKALTTVYHTFRIIKIVSSLAVGSVGSELKSNLIILSIEPLGGRYL